MSTCYILIKISTQDYPVPLWWQIYNFMVLENTFLRLYYGKVICVIPLWKAFSWHLEKYESSWRLSSLKLEKRRIKCPIVSHQLSHIKPLTVLIMKKKIHSVPSLLLILLLTVNKAFIFLSLHYLQTKLISYWPNTQEKGIILKM